MRKRKKRRKRRKKTRRRIRKIKKRMLRMELRMMNKLSSRDKNVPFLSRKSWPSKREKLPRL
jgi:hypothetical protein